MLVQFVGIRCAHSLLQGLVAPRSRSGDAGFANSQIGRAVVLYIGSKSHQATSQRGLSFYYLSSQVRCACIQSLMQLPLHYFSDVNDVLLEHSWETWVLGLSKERTKACQYITYYILVPLNLFYNQLELEVQLRPLKVLINQMICVFKYRHYQCLDLIRPYLNTTL
ncbi:hypothetical protein FGO68_gene9202 [Halteria grandinella]|uniref:Uncharacterized protein n=1 Tax=Halteria grandinella TaxID=5974 RepID=A0A8J8P4Y6_HALGN|nr:hypothetical protein FGO68_gene9202 [Halteria grandinella]